MKIESLAKRERILGPSHPDVIKAIIYVGDFLIGSHKYEKGLKLWHYALKQYRDTPSFIDVWFFWQITVYDEN